MSYIRSGSNPEALYIFGCICGTNEWSWTDAQGERQEMRMPPEVFTKICLLWDDCFDEDIGIEYKGAIVREAWVMAKDDMLLSDKEASDALNQTFKALAKDDLVRAEKSETNCKVMVEYKGQRCFMWAVTWEYVVSGVVQEEKRFSRWGRIKSWFQFRWWNLEDAVRWVGKKLKGTDDDNHTR